MSVEAALWPLLLLTALAIVLGVALASQIRQRNALRDWLTAPELQTIPDGSGAWREIFSRLQALRKKERRQHHELGKALERLRLIVQALPDGVMLLDGQLRIVWLNDAACRHFALDATRDAGILAGQLIRQSEFQQLIGNYRAHPSRSSTQLRVAVPEGERVLSVILIPFSDTDTLLVSTDVTEQVRTENIRRDFIANVSHELRTPLTVITGFLEQFDTATPPTGDEARIFIRMMNEQAGRMNRLVADLLTLSRLENDERPPADETIDVAALVSALRAEALALSGGKHTIEIAEISAAKLRGSADEITSAFGNLVSNAVRYTPAGGRIALAWRLVDGQPTFSVTDTGIGIAPEHIPRLTERFYRAGKGRTTASGGTGLGLAIVKHVLTRHGGYLQIESTPGKGSTFSAVLPIERLIGTQ
ncbi:MAG: phosphate regulon sensor histidine kinase PhoR [Rhodocyclaceae bacterium]